MKRLPAPMVWFTVAAVLSGIAAWSLPAARAADDAAPDQPTTIQMFDKAQMTVPPQWKRVEVRSPIIEHEFSVAAKDDPQSTARITMMAAGGSVDDNVNRWKGQFTGGEAKDQKVEKTEVAGHTVYLVDVSGSFSERMGGGPFAGGRVVQRPDYAMAGAIIVNPDKQQYFVKMIGPEKVVQENRAAFAKMVKGIAKSGNR